MSYKYKMEDIYEVLEGLNFQIVNDTFGSYVQINHSDRHEVIGIEDLIEKYKIKTYKVESYEGYLGGCYDDFGLYETKEDAECGHFGGYALHELMKDFEGKKVRIMVEEI